jgi:hypothetical protein
MDKTLVKRSDFLKVKYKFFINRIVMYFSFLLFPVWLQQTQTLNLLIQTLVLIIYMIFMGGQWYLLGKEIDYRLKIFYRVNSSMDRTIYRIFMGGMITLILFNVLSFFPPEIIKYSFWAGFVTLGLFYSWPTRGKIIEESMTNQFNEIKFLDSFEKTVFLLSCLTFIISLPELPMFENTEALKLFFDPNQKLSGTFWNFLSVVYLPFVSYPKLYNLIWSLHFYFFGMGFFLVAFYGILRHFVSRRLSILGLFSVISTWSFSRILGTDYFSSMSTTAILVWTWSVLWATRSGTYRSGLLIGFVSAYITMINGMNFILFPITLIAFFFYFLKDQTIWYRRQWIKYTILGGVISLGTCVSNLDYNALTVNMDYSILKEHLFDLIYRKAFFVIAPIGVVLSFIYLLKNKTLQLTLVNFDAKKFHEIFFCIVSMYIIGLIFNPDFLKDFSQMWVLAFFSLIPLEWIFQSISRLRSKRNLIYAMYILVCVLDSHLENRIRIIGKMFLNEENLKHLIQF